MKGIRKLLSLNLALIFLLSCFATAVPAGAEEVEEQALPDKYIIVNGTVYDVTQDPANPEEHWKVYYDEEIYPARMTLDGYSGGSIYTNVNLSINSQKDNYIFADAGECGIYVNGALRLWDGYDASGKSGTLTVMGGEGCPAILAAAELEVDCQLTATSSSEGALAAISVEFWNSWPKKIYVGDSEANAEEGSYYEQKYIRIDYTPYTLSLDGNGGKTQDSPPKESISISFTCGTPGYLHLFPYEYKFKNGENMLLGWTDSKDGTGRFHSRREEYKFPDEAFDATIYALWESEEMKAITLKGYRGPENYDTRSEVIPWKKGETYTLPMCVKPGAEFVGWYCEETRETFLGNSQAIVNASVTLVAQYAPYKLKIGGQEVDADDYRTGNGWSYSPGNPTEAKLYINWNYTGEPIEVPGDVRVYLDKSLTGTEGKPAIYVDGYAIINANSGVSKDNPLYLTGGAGAPAVAASGDVTVNVHNSFPEVQHLIVQGGEGKTPAISSEKGMIRLDKKVYYAGADADDTKLVGRYSGEHYLDVTGTDWYYTVLSGVTTIPVAPEIDGYTFYGWRVPMGSWAASIWYKPGEAINAGSGTKLWAEYVYSNRLSVAITIDGNGGSTSSGSKYVMQSVTSPDLSLYRLPSSMLTYSGHTLRGYNTKADGSGKSYEKGGAVADDGKTLIYELYAQWESNSTGGGGGGGGGGAAPTDPVADAIKQAAKNGSITLEPPAKGEGVTLTQEHIKQILDKSLSVEAKTEMGSLKLSAETLARLAKENDGKELKFTLGKADDAGKISVGGLFLNLSVSAGGKEIHDVSGSAKIHLDGVGKGDIVTLVHYNADGTVKDISFIPVQESGLVEFQFDSLSHYSLLKRSETPAYLVFGDVGEKAWFGKAVSYAYQNKLFDGTSATSFSPDMKMNREMFATVLYRLAGSPAFSGESTFSDVADSSTYYYSAILWCAQNGIINGYPDGRFGVGDLVTREQMVSMLYRYAKDYAKEDVTAGADDPLQTYTDAVDISKGAYEAFRWAVGAGVLRGATATEMLPQATAARAEVAQILMNYAQRK